MHAKFHQDMCESLEYFWRNKKQDTYQCSCDVKGGKKRGGGGTEKRKRGTEKQQQSFAVTKG